MSGNLIHYGANKLTGNDVSFSWKSVAVSAVSGGMGVCVGDKLVGAFNIQGEFGQRFIHGIAGGAVSTLLRKSVLGEKSGYAMIAAEAVASAMAGSMLANESRRQSSALSRERSAMGAFDDGDEIQTASGKISPPGPPVTITDAATLSGDTLRADSYVEDMTQRGPLRWTDLRSSMHGREPMVVLYGEY